MQPIANTTPHPGVHVEAAPAPAPAAAPAAAQSMWEFSETTKSRDGRTRFVRWSNGVQHGSVIVDPNIAFDSLTEAQKIAYVESKTH